jgi:hypothetical protein
VPHATGSLPPLVLEAKVENFFSNLEEPQCGHLAPFRLLDRTRISLSLSHFPQ